MNIIDIQDSLKNFSEQQLVSEMQRPSGTSPQFLVLSEIQRRKRVRDDFAKREAANQPTVAQEAVAAAGVPQSGIMGMREAMNPKRTMVQNMRSGGIMDALDDDVIKAQNGGPLGFRLNNVGNIRPGAGFYGETGSDSGYASFKDKESGLRALSRLINTYSDSYGIDNIRDFVGRYAPRSDNPKSFDNYVSYLSNQLGVDPDESFDLAGRRSELIPAIIGFEQGREYSDMFDDNTIARAIEASKFDDESKIENALYGKNDNEYNNLAKQLMQSIIPSAQASTIFPEQEVNDGKKISRKQMYEDALNQSDYVPTANSNIAVQKEDMEKAQQLRNLRNIPSFSPFTTDTDVFKIDPEDRANIDTTINPSRKLTDDEIAEIERRREEIPDATVDAKARGIIGAFPFLRSDDEIAKRTEEIKESLSSRDDDEFISAYQKKTQETDDRKSGNIAQQIKELQLEDAEVPKLPQETKDEKTKSKDDSLPVSSLEQQIIDSQNRLEKNREQDKYLALAQAGLAIMASDSPTLAGAIGEGGVDGLKAFREANKRYEEGVIDLINARAKLKGKTTAGLTPNQALDAAVEFEKLASDLSLPQEVRDNYKSTAIRLRMMSGIENVGSGAYFDLTADS